MKNTKRTIKNMRAYNDALNAVKVATSVIFTDYSNYVAEKSNDGGCYSFTTEYYREDGGMFRVEHGTSCGGFSYCSYYGTFCNNDCESSCSDREYQRVSAKALAHLLVENEDEQVDIR